MDREQDQDQEQDQEQEEEQEGVPEICPVGGKGVQRVG
jgi:hypothetical protein